MNGVKPWRLTPRSEALHSDAASTLASQRAADHLASGVEMSTD